MQTGKRVRQLTAVVGATKLQAECDEYGAVYLTGEGTEEPGGSVPITDRSSLWEIAARSDNGENIPVYISHGEGEHEYVVYLRGEAVRVELETGRDRRLKTLSTSASGGRSSNQTVRAPMPGLLKALLVSEGAAVRKGEPLCILEAMKMENEIKSPGELVVKRIFVEAGNAVEKGTPLVELAPLPEEKA